VGTKVARATNRIGFGRGDRRTIHEPEDRPGADNRHSSPGDERIGTVFLSPLARVHRGSERSARGFTLLELLVVIAVILVLIAIALPNFLGAQRRARSVQCKSNLRALGQGLLQYKLDHSLFPPAVGCAGREPSPAKTCLGMGPAALGSWDGVPWALANLGYVPDREVFYCPVMAGLFPEEKESVRYAYNSSATDTGGASGGANHLEKDSGHLWLCRCAWLPAFASFDPQSKLKYPHGNDPETGEKDVLENVLRINGAVETVNGLREYNRQGNTGR